MSSSLVIRKRRDGTTAIEGGLPDEHVFAARWLARELGGIVGVTITVTTDDGVAEYEFTGFDVHRDDNGEPVIEDGEPKPNFTGLRAVRKGT